MFSYEDENANIYLIWATNLFKLIFEWHEKQEKKENCYNKRQKR